MADIQFDPNPALRAEYEAALAVLDPQIKGMVDLEAVSISPDLKGVIQTQIAERETRRNLIRGALDSLDAVVAARVALDADGYPALDQVSIRASLLSELQTEIDDLQAARGIFAPDQQATKGTIAMGSAVDDTKAP